MTKTVEKVVIRYYLDDVHKATWTGNRTVYRRKDGTEYINHLGQRTVRREDGVVVYESRATTIRAATADEIFGALGKKV